MYQLCCISCSPGPLGLTCTLVLEGQQWGEGYTGGVAGASPALQVGEAGGQQWIMVLVPGFNPWMDRQRLDAQPVPCAGWGGAALPQPRQTPEEEGKKSSTRFFLAEKLSLQNHSNVICILYK